MTEGLVPRIAEDGRPQAMASRCPSCILNPGGSSRVAPDVVREVIRSHRDADAVVTCHETYPGEPGAVIGPSACRGHLDRYPETLGARIAAWIGGWHLVDLPDISETRARQG